MKKIHILAIIFSALFLTACAKQAPSNSAEVSDELTEPDTPSTLESSDEETAELESDLDDLDSLEEDLNTDELDSLDEDLDFQL